MTHEWYATLLHCRFVGIARWSIAHLALFYIASICSGNEIETVTLPYYDDVLTTTVSIADEKHLFVLDTGATHNAIDTRFRHLLGEALHMGWARGAKGQRIKSVAYNPPEAYLGKLVINRDVPIACLDLSNIRSALGRDVVGLLGMPFFAQYIIQADFDKRQLHVLPASTKPSHEWGESLNVKYTESNLPVVKTRMGSYSDEPCVIDIGFSGTASLRSEVFEYLLETQVISPDAKAHTATLRTVSSSKKGFLSEFELEGNVHKNLSVIKSKSSLSRIGINYFRRYKVTFDLGKGRIFLSKGMRYTESDDNHSFGIGMLRQKRKTVVKVIVPDSPAEKAGFNVDDELIAVAGQDIVDKPLSEIRWMMKSEMKIKGTLVATIQRKGKKKSLQLTSIK